MSFLSLGFLSAAALLAVMFPLCGPVTRTVVFLGASGVFAWSHLGAGFLPFLGVAGLGYGLARWVVGRSFGSLIAALVGLTTVFVWLRDYEFLATLPDGWRSPWRLVGLSFLFFKVVHVVVDRASGGIADLRVIPFLAYTTSFTTLLAGPIQRFQDFSRAWSGESAEPLTLEHRLDLVIRILRGLVKKYVLAEWIAPLALLPGDSVLALGWAEIAQGCVLFYVYLYCDFSGYCDIVIGLGALLGLRPPENFHFPFLSPNVAEYWLRVHRSLTEWLASYVFNPTYAWALRSRWFSGRVFLATAASLMLTMVVSGLWHGVTANFLLFGLVHGVFLVAFRAYERVMVGRLGRRGLRELRSRWWHRVLGTLITFSVCSLGYAFFVLDVPALQHLWSRIFG